MAATSPGTPIERGPALRSSAVTRVGSAAAGIWPADTTASRRPRWNTSSVATPPGPDMYGSTTCRAKDVASAASMAEPPWRRISIPAIAARGWAAATQPRRPMTVGRNARPCGAVRPCVLVMLSLLPGSNFDF